MIVGLASLCLARDPGVIEVHGFEPFQSPFMLALRNFRRNPRLSAKIIPRDIGLGGANDELSVPSSAGSNISVSIRGQQSGDPETIIIKDAAEVIGGLTSRAASNQRDVIAKIDCGGSEFSIIESLARAGLLKGIRVLMIERHKWWSAAKSQKDIVEPLIDNNLVVLDRA